jgi:uncharacterized protein YjbJ (UPF0337 family)
LPIVQPPQYPDNSDERIIAVADNQDLNGLGQGGFGAQGGSTGAGGAGGIGGSSAAGFGGGESGGTTTIDNVKDQANQLVGQAKEQLQGVRDQAMKLKDDALSQARGAAEQGKTRAAETIEELAQSARGAVEQLRQNPTAAPVAKYGDQAADALERFANMLRQKEVDQLVNDVAGLVRRNPAIAAGVAVAAGFAISRLLRGGSSQGFNNDYDA